MKYLPILDELFSSDLIYIVLIGIGVAIICASVKRYSKKNTIAMIAAFLVYIICELMCNIIYNFLLTFILIFIGSFALGFSIGSLVIRIIISIKNRK